MILPAHIIRRLLQITATVLGISWLGLSASLAQIDDQVGININDVIANGQGVVVHNADPSDIENAGDVNNDGYPDLIIGSSSLNAINGQDPTGGAFVVFGGPSFRGDIDAFELNGTNGFVINGIDPGDSAGRRVSGIGDFNGDGFDDVVVNASDHENGQTPGISRGEAYIIYGRDSFPASINLVELNIVDGLRINNSQGFSSFTVSRAGDINDDGIDDLLTSGEADIYVVYGKRELSGYLDLSNFDATDGVVISPVNDGGNIDFLSPEIAAIGDINNDGVSDIVLPARFNTYVVFGNSRLPSRIELESIDGSNGFVVQTVSGPISSSGSGDINGDGIDDLIIGLWGSNPDGVRQAGTSYLIYGQSSFESPLRLDEIDGRNGVEFPSQIEFEHSGMSVDGAGDVNYDGFQDLLISAPTTQGAPFPANNYGRVYLVFGQPAFDSPTVLSTLDSSMGLRIDDPLLNRNFGDTVSGLGDINADGIDDFAIRTLSGFYPGVVYVVFGRANWIGDDTPPTRSCGRPSIDFTTDQGIFLWQECPGGTPNGDWHLLAVAGGSEQHLRYNGVIETDVLQAELNRVEPSDSLQSNANSAAFSLAVVKSWVDGMDFSTGDNASVCADITLNDRDAPLFLGARRQQLDTSTPVELRTGAPCTLSPRQAICGRPSFDGTAGLYLWQSCGMDQWHLAAVSDQDRYRFDGTITIDSGISDVRRIRFESSDTVQVLSPDSLGFDMRVIGGGHDAVLFRANRYEADTACLSLSSASTIRSVFVGRHSVESELQEGSLDLFSLQRCPAGNPAS